MFANAEHLIGAYRKHLPTERDLAMSKAQHSPRDRTQAAVNLGQELKHAGADLGFMRETRGGYQQIRSARLVRVSVVIVAAPRVLRAAQ